MSKEKKIELLPIYNKALELYRNRNFVEAKKLFQKCLEIYPEDGPSKIFLERCDIFIQNPPPDDWDGVFVMTSK